jgi:hypothetical protein
LFDTGAQHPAAEFQETVDDIATSRGLGRGVISPRRLID